MQGKDIYRLVSLAYCVSSGFEVLSQKMKCEKQIQIIYIADKIILSLLPYLGGHVLQTQLFQHVDRIVYHIFLILSVFC